MSPHGSRRLVRMDIRPDDALGPDRFADDGDVRLCFQTVGDPADPTVLLVGGLAASMDWWPADLCAAIASLGFSVVRYDHRDTGRSTTYPPGKPPYTGADLAQDALRVLDSLDVRAAHLMGVSMGGALAQRLAVEHPRRVATLTLIATTRAVASPATPLPPASPALDGLWTRPGPDPADRSAVVEALVAEDRALSRERGFVEARTRAVATRAVGRTLDPAAAGNHLLADDGPPVRGSLADVTAPRLVVHGSDDPLFPGHGAALAAEISQTRLLELDGMGHQAPPPACWPALLPALRAHLAGREA